jgi:hypothetical protein
MSPKGFDLLIGQFRKQLAAMPDKRTGSNSRYSMEDIGMGAFSVFFTQSSSFLAHQKAMQEKKAPTMPRRSSKSATSLLPQRNHAGHHRPRQTLCHSSTARVHHSAGWAQQTRLRDYGREALAGKEWSFLSERQHHAIG